LGLPINANKDQIRRRHRELVRKFHPDAQPNLGPVAQKEATNRFRAIQHAYELLTDTP
jgi:DnaJ-class molecular chaperone